jgi:hypothetical protein
MAKKEKNYNPVEDHNKKLRQKKKNQRLELKKKIKKHGKNKLPDKVEEKQIINNGIDFNLVVIPHGKAPETDGQIYHALDLQIIRNAAVSEQPTTSIPIIITQPQHITQVQEPYYEPEPTHQPQTSLNPSMPWDNIEAYASDSDEEITPVTLPPSSSIKNIPVIRQGPIDYSRAVVQAAPQKRDLMKELVGMVPASLQRKMN